MVLDLFAHMVSLLAGIPGAMWHVASPAILAMVAFYVLLVMAVGWEGKNAIRWGCALGVVLLLGWWAWSPRPMWDGDTMRVTFLDVGQGDATVIELPDGQTVLIDGGPAYERLDIGRAVIGPYLWDRGIRHLDHVISTHPQLDHVGGLAWVLRAFEVDHYWSNGAKRDKLFYQRLQQAVEEKGLVEEIAWAGQEVMNTGRCRFWTLNPPLPDDSPAHDRAVITGGSHLNNLSVVTRLDCGTHSFLFTADAETEALFRLDESDVAKTARVVKIPHHGAKSSFALQWIRELDAEAAVVSVGKRNRYGHPASVALDAYARQGIPLFRTDQDGAVWITAALSSPEHVIQTAKEWLPRPIRLDGSILSNERANWVRLWNQWSGVV